MIFPTVHLNGTSKDEMIDRLSDAGSAVHKAIDALIDARPNARDYYPQGPDAFAQADREHNERLTKLRAVYDELAQMHEHLTFL